MSSKKRDTYKIAVEMPMALYRKIRSRSDKEKKSFSAVASDLLACGLLDVEHQEETEDYGGYNSLSTLERLQALEPPARS